MAKDVTLTIDGRSVTVPEGTLLVEAAKTIASDIPVYCYHPKLGPAGLCRICLVEVEKMPKLQIACNTTVAEGMVVHTQSAKSNEGRRAVLEFLLLNHPLDCPICDKGGECDLQDFSMAYGQGASRLADEKLEKPKAVDLGPTIVLDEERCIVCQRCVRFDDIITREQSLVVVDRGAHDIIATASGEAYESNFSGNVTELCPVGALTSKTYRFKSRPWDLHRTRSTCTQCSVGCGLQVDERGGTVLRTMSREDDPVSEGWLCDRGRYNVGFYDDPARIVTPLWKRDGEWTQIGWDDAIDLWAKSLSAALAATGPQSIGALGGGRLLNEEAFALQQVYRGLGSSNLDWRTGRQLRAAPARFGGTYLDLENAEVILVVGVPPSQSSPVMDLRIRKAVTHKRARLFVTGTTRSGSFVPETVISQAVELRAALEGATRVALVWDGSDDHLGAALDALAEQLAADGHTVHAFVAGDAPNGRGAEAMGMLPGQGLDARGMFAAAKSGALRSLAILGANPVLRFPDRRLVEEALANVSFLVVSELFLTDTAQYAQLVLPARGAFEKSGHTTNAVGDVLAVNAAVSAPDGPLSDGQMLVALADALGVALPSPAEVAARARALAAPQDARALRAASADGDRPRSENSLVLRIDANIFAGGGTVAFDARLAELRPAPTLALGARDAAALGARSGDLVDVRGEQGTLAGLRVDVRNAHPEGVAAIVDGLPDAPANRLGGAFVTLENVRSPAHSLAGALPE